MLNVKSWYLPYILKAMDGYQKDYYRQCTNYVIWHNYPMGADSVLYFFKNDDELWEIINKENFAYRAHVRYRYFAVRSYPLNSSKEQIINMIIQTIIKLENKELRIIEL